MSKIPRIVPISDPQLDAALVLKNVQYSEHERELLRLLAKAEKEITENQGYRLDSVLKKADSLLQDHDE